VSSSFDKITQLDTTTSLGIPLTKSLTAGFTAGLIGLGREISINTIIRKQQQKEAIFFFNR